MLTSLSPPLAPSSHSLRLEPYLILYVRRRPGCLWFSLVCSNTMRHNKETPEKLSTSYITFPTTPTARLTLIALRDSRLWTERVKVVANNPTWHAIHDLSSPFRSSALAQRIFPILTAATDQNAILVQGWHHQSDTRGWLFLANWYSHRSSATKHLKHDRVHHTAMQPIVASVGYHMPASSLPASGASLRWASSICLLS